MLLKYMKQFGNNSMLISDLGCLNMLHLKGVGEMWMGEREVGNLLKLRGEEQ